MNVRLGLIPLVLLVALAVPAGAGADVRSELNQASTALEAAIEAADNGDAGGTAANIAANASHSDRARQLAGSLESAKQRARALARVGGQYEENFFEYLDEISLADPALQQPLAVAMSESFAAREQVVGSLLRVLHRLPEAVQSRTLGVLADLESDGDLEALVDTYLDEDVIAEVRAMIRSQIEQMLDRMQAVIDRLGGLADTLPPDVADYVQDALEQISAELSGLPDAIDELLADLFDGEGVGVSPICNLLAGLPIALPGSVCG